MIEARLVLSGGRQDCSRSLPSATLAAIVAGLADFQQNETLLEWLAHHDDLRVRKAIAKKVSLSGGTLLALAADKASSVVDEACQSIFDSGRGESPYTPFGSPLALAICQRGSDLAATVAFFCEGYTADDALYGFLKAHPDTEVREFLAINFNTPQQVCDELASKDPDEYVRMVRAEWYPAFQKPAQGEET